VTVLSATEPAIDTAVELPEPGAVPPPEVALSPGALDTARSEGAAVTRGRSAVVGHIEVRVTNTGARYGASATGVFAGAAALDIAAVASTSLRLPPATSPDCICLSAAASAGLIASLSASS
jgi:hypothetical protein